MAETPSPSASATLDDPKPADVDALDCGAYTPGTGTRTDFLCAHNEARASVAPAPLSPLPPLAWNADLAQVAQAYAERCTWEHNADRGSDYAAIAGGDVYIGENLYLSSALTVTPYDAVAAWAGEARFYDYAANACDAGEMCGHYTQVVWGETLAVGCGMADCRSIAGLANATLVVCDYAPGGNIAGRRPY